MLTTQMLCELDAVAIMAGAPSRAIVDEILLIEIERVDRRIEYLGAEGASTVARHISSAARSRRIELDDLVSLSRRAQHTACR